MPEALSSILPKINLKNLSGEIAAIVRDEIYKKGIQPNGKSIELNKILHDSESRNKYS